MPILEPQSAEECRTKLQDAHASAHVLARDLESVAKRMSSAKLLGMAEKARELEHDLKVELDAIQVSVGAAIVEQLRKQ